MALTVKANQDPNSCHIIELLDWQDHLDQYIMVLEWPSPCVNMRLFWQYHGDLFSEELAHHFMWQVIDAAAVILTLTTIKWHFSQSIMWQTLAIRDSDVLPSRVLWEGRVPREGGNGVVARRAAVRHDHQPFPGQQRYQLDGRSCLVPARLLRWWEYHYGREGRIVAL